MPPLLAAACARAPEPRPLVPVEAAGVGAVEIYGQGLIATDDSGQTVTFALDASASVVAVRVWPGARLEALYPLRAKDTTYFQTGPHRIPVPPPVTWVRAFGPGPDLPSPHGSQVGLEQEAQRCMWNELLRQRPSPVPRAPADTSRRRARQTDTVDLAAIEDRCRRAVGLTGPPPRRETRVPIAGEYYLLLVATDATVDAKHLQLKLAGVDISTSSLLSVLQVLPGFLAGPRAHTWAGYAARVGVP